MNSAGFSTFLAWTALVAAVGCGVGDFLAKDELRRDCLQSGEIQIQTVFYSCEPVGSLVRGERIAFKKAYRE